MQATIPTVNNTSPCTTCEQPITREAAEAFDVLFSSYRLDPSGLAREIEKELSRRPEATDAEILDMAFYVWFGVGTEALVPAVRHKLIEEEAGF